MSDEDTPIKEPPSTEQPVVPPAQSEKLSSSRPIFGTWWFWAIVIAVAILIAAVAVGVREAPAAAVLVCI